MYDSRAIANKFIDLAKEQEVIFTPMQLLKLVYIAHGWMLGLHQRPLIKDEVQAWQYGPVIPKLYNAMRNYRGNPVTKHIKADNENLDDRAESIIRQVYRIYGSYTGPALSRLTHADGSPWDLTYEPGSFGMAIPTDLIQDHYAKLATKAS